VFGLIYPYGIFLQALAILHFVRRRPDTYWIWVILMFGGIGALIYIAVEVLPDAGLLRGAFQVFPRRKRIGQLEGMILDNPSVGNYEELGDLYWDDGQVAKARECFDKVLARSDSIHASYHRALCELAVNDFNGAAADLGSVTGRDPKYDYQRAAGLQAHALAKIGQRKQAIALFEKVTETSTLSETQYNYACLLADEGRHAEAHDWAKRILAKKATMPDYIRRQERPWFRKARALIKRLPRTPSGAGSA
jgi:hypothetical protein